MFAYFFRFRTCLFISEDWPILEVWSILEVWPILQVMLVWYSTLTQCIWYKIIYCDQHNIHWPRSQFIVTSVHIHECWDIESDGLADSLSSGPVAF